MSLLAFVYAETRSPTWVAVAGVVRLLPYLIFGTLGGVVADRYERRTAMIASDLVRAATMFALALAAFSGSVGVALVIVGLSVVASTPYQPALSAMIPSLVPEDDLAAANSAMSVIENVALALGPALGGVLLLVGSSATAFTLNGFTFLISALFLVLVRARSRASEESQAEPLSERLIAGFRAIAHSADVAMLMARSSSPRSSTAWRASSWWWYPKSVSGPARTVSAGSLPPWAWEGCWERGCRAN